MKKSKKDLPLIIRYRPSNFSRFLGNSPIKKSIRLILAQESGRPHSMLFVGEAGIGKTSLARIVAKKLGAKDFDLQEYDAAHYGGVDLVRDVRRVCNLCPRDEARVFVFDEAHRLTESAQNGLLKPLEEPCSTTYFILCTSEPRKLIPAIRSRCTTFFLQPLTAPETRQFVKMVCRKEAKEISRSEMKRIIRESEGVPREVLRLLEQAFLQQ